MSILQAIYDRVQSGTDYQAYLDLKHYCKSLIQKDKTEQAVEYLVKLSDRIEQVLPKMTDEEQIRKFYELHIDVCRVGAPYSFHLFLLFMESNRAPEKKFYPPRRKQLRPLVDAMQELSEGKLTLLCISMPPGTGKSTLALFYICWLAGQTPDKCILTGSHSNAFIRGAYDEALRMLEGNGEYRFGEVFPQSQVANTNAKDCRIDLGKRKRFESLQFTSIGTGNAGLYRASRLLYCDDLIPSIEVALSADRLDKVWEQYTTDLRQRKIGDCAELIIATRWACRDVIGRLEQQYGDSDKAKFIVMPALDENDESNFDYPYGVGFSTAFYHEQREIMDDVNWRALYMNQPIEREGLIFPEDELRRYFELPLGEPDAIIGACDTKSTGADYCVMPIAYVYGQDYYIEDVVCENYMPNVVDSRLVDCLLRNKVQLCRFESNSAGGRVAQKVQELVKGRNGITRITTKYTISNKETRIIVNSAFVIDRFLFKDSSCYKPNSDYGKFMKMNCSYTIAGKNQHDDTVDALAQLSEFAQGLTGAHVEVFKRPF